MTLTDDALSSDGSDHLSSLENVKSLVKRGEKQCRSSMHQMQVFREDYQLGDWMVPIEYHRVLLGVGEA